MASFHPATAAGGNVGDGAAAHEVIDDGSGVRLACAGGVFLSFFYGPPTVERLDFLFEHEKRLVADAPRFSSISVVDPRVGREMPSDARHRARDITQYFNERMVASCTVVQGSGFFPAMVRSVLAGIQLLSSRKVSWHVASSPEEAVQFVKGVHDSGKLAIDVDAVRVTLDRVISGQGAGTRPHVA